MKKAGKLPMVEPEPEPEPEPERKPEVHLSPNHLLVQLASPIKFGKRSPLPWKPDSSIIAWIGPEEPSRYFLKSLPTTLEDCRDWINVFTLPLERDRELSVDAYLCIELLRADVIRDPGPSNHEVVVARARLPFGDVLNNPITTPKTKRIRYDDDDGAKNKMIQHQSLLLNRPSPYPVCADEKADALDGCYEGMIDVSFRLLY